MKKDDLKTTPLEIKSKEKTNFTYHDLNDFAYQKLIPTLIGLADEIGLDKLIELLKPIRSQIAKKALENAPPEDNSFTSWTAALKKNDGFEQHVSTYEIIEDTDTVFEIKVTECLSANFFLKYGESKLGHAFCCHADGDAARAFNPKIKLIRSKTILEGHGYCNHRWVLED